MSPSLPFSLRDILSSGDQCLLMNSCHLLLLQLSFIWLSELKQEKTLTQTDFQPQELLVSLRDRQTVRRAKKEHQRGLRFGYRGGIGELFARLMAVISGKAQVAQRDNLEVRL